MKDLAVPKSGARLSYLDNIRIFLTALVIVHHSTLAFGGGGSWEVSDPARNELTTIILTYFTAVNQTYFMSAFFLLAGYFTPRSYEKKGSGSFLLDRLIRLGIPLLVYSTLIINLNWYLVEVVWLTSHSPGYGDITRGTYGSYRRCCSLRLFTQCTANFQTGTPIASAFSIIPIGIPPTGH